MNPITRVHARWREWLDIRDQDKAARDRLTADMSWLHPADTNELPAVVDDGKAQASKKWGVEEGLREDGRPRKHQSADRPGHRVAPDPTDEEVTVDG